MYPPGPRPDSLTRYLKALRRDPTAGLLTLAREYGDLVHFKVGPQHVYLVNHPDFIQEVLVTHRDRYQTQQPPFYRHPSALKDSAIMDQIAHISAGWQDNQTLDIAAAMKRLTTAALGGILFNAEGKHRVEGHPDDLLSTLMAAQDVQRSNAGLSQTPALDEAVALLAAGHETTASAITWTFYLLAQYPQVADQLEKEIDTVLGGRRPTVDDINRLAYTRMVFAESLRLYPPVWVMGRRATAKGAVGGYTIPVGATVLVSPWVVHHDPRYYPEPFHFDPQRWTAEGHAGRPRFAYFPFGYEPYLCLSEQLAWTAGVLVIAALAQDWRMRLAPGWQVELQPHAALQPRHGLHVVLERRPGE